jgi:hypothetical protein
VETLELVLEPTPKVMRLLTARWCPHAFVVAFKLETHEPILLPKARQTLLRAGPRLVVANLLATRHARVFLLGQATSSHGTSSSFAEERSHDAHAHAPSAAAVATTPAPGAIPPELAMLTVPVPAEDLLELTLSAEELSAGAVIEASIVEELARRWDLYIA